MISLITLMPDSELVFGADISLNVNGQEFIAFCSPLWDRRKVLIAASVDADLIDLVCCCLAKDPKDRPALIDLADHVQQQVQFRDQAFYGEAEWESDGSILTRMSGILADASIDPPVSISRGRHTTEIQSGYS